MFTERRSVAPLFAAVAALAALGWSAASNAAHPVQDLQAGHWYRAAGTQLAALDPCPNNGCSYSANEGQSAVVDDWTGGAFATGYGTMGGLVVWGGGHNGYYGNELYVFDVATLKWARVTQPVANPTCNYTEGELQNGSPCSPHTYDYVDYHAPTNSFVKLGSASDHDRGGHGSPRVHLFDFDTNTWRRGARKPTFPGVGGEGGLGHTGASSAYDPNRDVFWVLPAYNGRFAKYDPNASSGGGQWTEYNRYNIDIDAVSAIDPTRDLFVTFEALLTQTIIVHDLKNPSAAGVTVNVAGDQSFFNAKGNGFEWDPVAKAFVGWMGGTSVFKVVPPSGDWRTGTWQIVRVNAAGTNTVTPSAKNMNDTYSRWRYVPAANAFVVVNRNTDDVYFYKLTNGTGGGGTTPAPTVNLSANPTSVASGGTSSLTWSSTNATACTASGAWSGTKAVSGSQQTAALTQTSTFSLACSGAGGTTSRSATVTLGTTPPPGGGDWEARSTAPGVVQAITFTQAQVDQGRFANGNDPNLLANVKFNPTGGVDGQGALRIDVPSWTSADPGAWRVAFPRFWGSGVNHTRFYVQFRFRVSAGRTSSCQSGDGWKISNISSYNRSLTAFEVVPWNYSNTGWLRAYYGGSPPFTPDPSPDFVMPENEWITVYTEIQAARYDGSDPNNRMLLRAARDGATQWTTLYNLTGGSWYESDGNAPSGFDGLWFTPYSTHRQANVCASGWHEYDELIVSTQPIALPGQGTSPPPAPTLSLAAAPQSIGQGASSTLSWTSSNATSCTASGAWSGAKSTAGSQAVSPTATSTYTLACTGTGGTISRSATVTVTSSTPAPTVTLAAAPPSIAPGGSSTLNWTSSNATSCTASGGWSGSKAMSGSQGVSPDATTTYTLACTGSGGTTQRSATVTVTSSTPAPTLTFTATPTSVPRNGASQLAWAAQNATSCAASGAWSGTKPTTGSARTAALTSSKTYTLRCTGSGGSTTKSVTVTVTSSPGPSTGPLVYSCPDSSKAGVNAYYTTSCPSWSWNAPANGMVASCGQASCTWYGAPVRWMSLANVQSTWQVAVCLDNNQTPGSRSCQAEGWRTKAQLLGGS